jgi:hypothetical protein
MDRQVFGWTDQGLPAPGKCVKFLAVFRGEGGVVRVQIRNEKAEINEIILPAIAARDLGATLL